MKQEDRELLLKDLCSRLPYGAKVYGNYAYSDGEKIIDDERVEVLDASTLDWASHGIEIKPYLFPISSMTEEQKKEISKIYNLHTCYGLNIEITNRTYGCWEDDNSCHLQDYLWLVDWFNKNHFDYRGLIEKGLAIDATGKNIY